MSLVNEIVDFETKSSEVNTGRILDKYLGTKKVEKSSTDYGESLGGELIEYENISVDFYIINLSYLTIREEPEIIHVECSAII
jgi:hypothetical protein